MKTFLITITILLGTISALTQEREFTLHIRLPENLTQQKYQTVDLEKDHKSLIPEAQCRGFGLEASAKRSALILSKSDVTIEISQVPNTDNVQLSRSPYAALSASNLPEDVRGFDWKPALIQAGIFTAIQQGFRLNEEKTRDELDGPFLKDWKASLKNLRGWDDGGKFFTNYVGHPMQGAITGRIYVNNSPSARNQVFGKSKDYWISRFKAMAWSAVWSTQFELGPISEASIGNVGQKLAGNGRSKLTYGDLVMTPVGGTGLLIVEDAVDKYILRGILERKLRNLVMIKLLRSFLTPMTAFANILRGRAPWWRDDRMNSKCP